MCGRYTLFSNLETVMARFSVIDARVQSLNKNYNIHPTQNVLTILNRGKIISAEMMRWGLTPSWVSFNQEVKTIHNSRIESVLTRPTFKSIVKTQRCLIPSNGFYEGGKTTKGSHPFFIHRQQNCLFAFAGIWATELSDSGTKTNSCSIITKPATSNLSSIHSRMPVILNKGQETIWMNENSYLPGVLDSLSSKDSEPEIHADHISTYVNSPHHSDEKCIIPIPKLL